MTGTAATPGAGSIAADVLRYFANTIDVETGTDDLATPDDLAAWLAGQGLAEPGAHATDDDLATARQLRAALRQALADHHDGALAETYPALDAVAARLPLRLALHGGQPVLRPAQDGVAGGLAGILAAVAQAGADGTWGRLKLCQAQSCQWAFLDASRNRSRTWCEMGVCGNRAKTRAYRARRRGGERA